VNVLIWGIYLTIFCLPLYLVRFEIFSIPTNVLELMIGILFIAWVIKKFKIQNSKFKIEDSKLLIPIILILIGVSIATIFSWDLRVSAGIWKSWFVAPLLFFIILITTIKKPKEIKKIFWVFISSGFIVAIISLIYLIRGDLDVHGRLQAFHNSPNYLAMYLAPVLLVSFWYYFFTFLIRPSEANSGLSPSLSPPLAGNRARFGLKTREKTTPKSIFLIVSCLLFVVILFFTKSFGAWMGIIVGLGFGLFLYLYKSDKKKSALVIIVLGILLVLLLVYIKGFILPEGGISLDARIKIWQKALEIFKSYPIIGIGPGTFEDYFPFYPKWGVPQPHNLYLAFLLQTGIIGFVGFIWLIIVFFKKGFELLKTQNLMPITFISVMTYILIHGLADTTYWKNDLSVIFWMIIGLITVLPRPRSGPR